MSILSPLTKPLMKQIRKDFGQVSDTQRIALEAGTAHHEEQLFTGKPDWDAMALPQPEISAEAQAFLDNEVETFCKMINDWDIQNREDMDMPEEAWAYLRDNNFFGLVIGKQYGGKGFNALEHAMIVSKIATHTLPGALTVMVPNSLGPGELLTHYGTEEQKNEILPQLADGRLLPCFALTEPHAGSDAAGIRTTGVVYRDPESNEAKIRINGEKRYITLAPRAGIVGLACRLEDPEEILGKGKEPGITCVLLPRDTEGMSIGTRHRPMDIPFHNGPIFLKDAVTSVNNIIGGPEKAGEGWRMLMECLGIGRSISLPNTSLAAGRRATIVSGAYARAREQFGFSLADMKALHGHLARIGGLTYMINAAATAMAQRVDTGETPSIGSAILKVHATTAMKDIVYAANRLMGGKAIQQGPHNLMGMTYWGVPIAETVEGDNVMTESVVVYAQGLKKAHPYLSRLVTASEQNDSKAFDKALFGLVGNTISNTGRSFFMGLTNGGGKGPEGADGKILSYYKKMNRLCSAFNISANITMAVMGGGIQREQNVSRRLGRIYANVLLAHYALDDHRKAGASKAEWPIVEWVVQSKLHAAEQELKELVDNYPSLPGRLFLRAVTMPLGLRNKAPSDKLEAEVARLVSNPGPARARLARNSVIPTDDPHNPVGQIENLLHQIVEVEEPILKKLKSSMDRKEYRALMESPDLFTQLRTQNLLPEEEIKALENITAERRRAIDTDHFKQENLRKGISVNPL